MSSLADLPEVVGFFSYSREDDEGAKGALSAFRDAIQRELSGQLGRSKQEFHLWQDVEAIAPGTLWETEINGAIQQSIFFIPIITPRVVRSKYCRVEFEAFLARERALGRADLVFPVLYMTVPALQDEAQWRNDPLLSIVGQRQYLDWRAYRHLDVKAASVSEAIERFCSKIVAALYAPLPSQVPAVQLNVDPSPLPAVERPDQATITTAIQAAEAERRRHAAERQADEEREQREREARRLGQEEEARRVRHEEEARRARQEEEARRARQEEEARRVRQEEEARLAAERRAQELADEQRRQREAAAAAERQRREQNVANETARRRPAPVPPPPPEQALPASAPMLVRRALEATALPLLLLLLWQLASTANVMSEQVLPGPASILARWVTSLSASALHAGVTLTRFGIGFLIGVSLGLAVRFSIMTSSRVRLATMPLLRFLGAIPAFAYVPPAMLMLGFGLALGILAAAIAAFFSLLLDSAVTRADATDHHSARPDLLPVTAQRDFTVAAAASLAAALASEFYASTAGLAYIASSSLMMFDELTLFSSIVSASLLAAAIYAVALVMDRLLDQPLRDATAALGRTVDPNRAISGAAEPSWLRLAQGAAAPILLVAVWELLSRGGLISPIFLPTPEAILARWLGLVASGQLLADVATTGSRLVAAVALSQGLALLLLHLTASQVRIAAFIRPLIRTLGMIPSVLWVPLALSWFAPGWTAAIVAATAGAFFSTAIRMADGLPHRAISPAQLVAATRLGLRVAFGVVIVAEIFVPTGLGHAMLEAGSQFDTAALFAELLMVGLLGLACDVAVTLIVTRIFIRAASDNPGL